MTEVQTTSVTDNVRVATYAIETIRELIPEWVRISRVERLAALEDLEPETEFSTHNVSTSAYREYLAQLHNPEVNSQSVIWTHMAFGADDTAESLGDEHLENEVYRDAIDDHVDNSTEQEYAGVLLIGSDEAVGLNLKEAALVSEADPGNADDITANRALLVDPDNRLDPKDSDHAVTVRIELSYLDNSEVA
jgi:hypothetical protein